ncbi:uncharacterized protein G2W53_025153 [Senna tora]|uniref:GAG-pre-integrase domain-containing protein n=1 Tax=Senna tora TaxID=362788 RepID=A0A834TCY4_9FABA|nr:uncharacterized protein G2W53_025153 [Senna tora]
MAETPSSSINQSKDGSVAKSTDSNSGFYRRDPLYLHPTDHTGLQLVTILLTTSNYMIWSRFMKMALKSKNKLGFVDGSCPKPTDENSDRFFQWTFVDSTVTAWIVNSMTKELAEAYVFTTSARRLWKTLEDKYGKADKPQAFNIKKRLAAMKQNGDSLAAYSNKLEKYWEELNTLEPKLRCSGDSTHCCDANKQLDDRDSSNQVMQFLMGLDDCYDTVVNNILMLDPIPSYNKVYAIVATIESKKVVVAEEVASTESSALAVKTFEQQRNNFASKNTNSGFKKDVKKTDRFCTSCNKPGHMEDTCFKKHGIPEWYKEYKNQRAVKSQSFSGNVSTTDSASQSTKGFDMTAFSEMIQQEVTKFMKNKTHAEEKNVSPTCFVDFTGNTPTSCSDAFFKEGNWIIDSGASSHISGSLQLFSSLRDVNNKNTVSLPDGTVKKVKYMGEVQLTAKIILKDVLYVPDFHYNLISVHRLAEGGQIQFVFTDSACFVQDLSNKAVLAVGHVQKHLYILNKKQLNMLAVCNSDTISHNLLSCRTIESNIAWHARLGHPSDNVLFKAGFNSTGSTNPVCDGYKVFELATGKTMVSRDIHFYESVFPYQSKRANSSDTVPLPVFNGPNSVDFTDHMFDQNVIPLSSSSTDGLPLAQDTSHELSPSSSSESQNESVPMNSTSVSSQAALRRSVRVTCQNPSSSSNIISYVSKLTLARDNVSC